MQKINKLSKENFILTIADYKGFTQDGGSVTFFSNKKDQIRFSINQKIAEKHKLMIAADLLNLSEKEAK